MLDAPVGTNLTFAWSSDGVLAMRSEVAIDGGHDDCGNVDGPWVVDTLAGTINATLLACQGGHRYDLTLIGSTAATGELRVRAPDPVVLLAGPFGQKDVLLVEGDRLEEEVPDLLLHLLAVDLTRVALQRLGDRRADEVVVELAVERADAEARRRRPLGVLHPHRVDVALLREQQHPRLRLEVVLEPPLRQPHRQEAVLRVADLREVEDPHRQEVVGVEALLLGVPSLQLAHLVEDLLGGVELSALEARLPDARVGLDLIREREPLLREDPREGGLGGGPVLEQDEVRAEPKQGVERLGRVGVLVGELAEARDRLRASTELLEREAGVVQGGPRVLRARQVVGDPIEERERLLVAVLRVGLGRARERLGGILDLDGAALAGREHDGVHHDGPPAGAVVRAAAEGHREGDQPRCEGARPSHVVLI